MNVTFEQSDKRLAAEITVLEGRIAKINDTRKLLSLLNRSLGDLYPESPIAQMAAYTSGRIPSGITRRLPKWILGG